MSEPDGIDEVVDGSLRQSLMAASRLAETLARMREESLRQREQQDTQSAHEAQVREAGQRAAAQGALAPVQKDQGWDQAQPKDIAQVHALAEGWKDHDPTSLAAAERIRYEIQHRYGIDTRDVGADAAYLESGIETISASQARRTAVTEHQKGMALTAAAQAEDLRAKAEKFAPEMEKHQVPVEYLSNPAMVAALQNAHDAKTPEAIEAANATVKERLYLHHRPAPRRNHREFQRSRRRPLQRRHLRERSEGMARSKTPRRGRLQRLPGAAAGTALRTHGSGTLRSLPGQAALVSGLVTMLCLSRSISSELRRSAGV
jgi:hypothetical protein